MALEKEFNESTVRIGLNGLSKARILRVYSE